MTRLAHVRHFATVAQMLALLGYAVPALADDAFKIPLDLQEIPTVDEDVSWTEAAERRPFRWQLTAGVRRETMSGPLDPLVNDINAIGFTSLALDADLALAPGLSLQGRAIIYTEGDITDFIVQRVKLEYAPAAFPVRASLGKEYLGWSFTDLAHVLDPSPRESARINRADAGDDYAHPYAMVAYENGPHRLSVLAMSEGHKFDDISTDASLFAVRYETQIGNASLSAQAIKRENDEAELGFGINTEVGTAILSFEGSVTSHQRLPLASTLPGGGLLSQAVTDKNTFQAVVAGRMPISNRWQAEAAYLFNGHGYTNSQWDYFRTAEDAVLASLSGGNFQYANFLSDAQVAHKDQYLRRNYITLALSSLENLGKWSVTVGGMYGLDDGGTFGFATASRPIGKSGRLDMALSGGEGGFGTEFARRPKEFSIQIAWEF